ncbi:hypothetical protein IJ182_06085 [bacterium]|nr:hypothetical protein [bacterium]
MLVSLNRVKNQYFKNNISKNTHIKKYSSLAPLKYDVISFKKGAKIEPKDMHLAPKHSDCRRVYDDAEPAMYLMEKVLDKYVGPLTEKKIGTDKHSAVVYKVKRKSPDSIREKVLSKYSHAAKRDEDDFCMLATQELIRFLPLKPDVNESNIDAVLRRCINYYANNTKLPPHANAPTILGNMRKDLAAYSLFELDKVSEETVDKVFADTIEKIQTQNVKNKHIVNDTYISPETVEGIKHYANDICQSRIILKYPDKQYTQQVLNAIEQAAKDNAIKIKSVENNLPSPDRLSDGEDITDYEYVDEVALRKFSKSVGAEYIRNTSKSGYMGIHINLDLSKPQFNSAYNNFSGEIQIIGQDVMELKEVEDLCYKIKDNKNIANRGYLTFQDYFTSFYNEDCKQAFDDYTYSLYMYQRKLPPTFESYKSFPTIEELGFEGKVPEQLDYNKLKVIKESCDKTIERKTEIENKSKSQNITLSYVKKRAAIDGMKQIVDFLLR